MLHEAVKEYYRLMLNELKANLANKGWEVYLFENTIKARDKILEILLAEKPGTVGIPGSITVRQLGLIQELKDKGFNVIQHWVKASAEEKQRLRIEETKANAFIHSANAVTRDGVIIIGDQNGNRIVGSVLGPKILILVIGFNKIVNSIDEGLNRVKNFASKVNAIRLGIDPEKEYEFFTLIIRRKPPLIPRGVIILVNEWLGF